MSTKRKPDHEAAFFKALSDYHWQPIHDKDQYANGDYSQLFSNKNVEKYDLIVAAGGIPAAAAVATALKNDGSSTPFIFLIGRYPLSASASSSDEDAQTDDLFSSANKAGGVDQSMVTQNENNFQFLKTKNVTIDKVGLIVNVKNPITKPEVAMWNKITDSGQNPNPNFIYSLPTNDDSGLSMLLRDIKSSSSQPTGLIVSSDAYLRMRGNVDFDTQLRSVFSGYVCYPFPEYVAATTSTGVVNPYTVYSPSTPPLVGPTPTDPTGKSASYYWLGMKAVDALINQNTPQLATWTWNGSSGSWMDGNFPT